MKYRSLLLVVVMTAAGAHTEEGDGGTAVNLSAGSNGWVALEITPPDRCRYLEIFCKNDLASNSSWSVAAEWLATFGGTVHWIAPGSSNETQGFFLIGDAEIETDGGDGRSDLYEEITGSDPAVFNLIDSDGDGLHDWWEGRLFGDLSQTETNDFDSDGLLNGEELVWPGTGRIVMHSDPSLYDSDNEGLNDFEERFIWNTDAMEKDSDFDGLDDAAEVLGAPPTDPNNPDTVSPVVVLAAG